LPGKAFADRSVIRGPLRLRDKRLFGVMAPPKREKRAERRNSAARSESLEQDRIGAADTHRAEIIAGVSSNRNDDKSAARRDPEKSDENFLLAI
jgi:hypothetical protein